MHIIATILVLSAAFSCRSGGVPLMVTRQAPDSAAVVRFLSEVDALRTDAGIPGLAVVVLRDTTVILAHGLGFADIEAGRRVTPETPFDIASVAKPLSAVVALRLAQDGVLDLDAPMRRYADFDEFCEAARDLGGIFYRDFACRDSALTMRHVLAMTSNGPRPGSRFWYNPPVYSWASRPMAELSRVPFSQLVDSLVFRPAGMRGAVRKHRNLPLPPDILRSLATPYHYDSSGRLVPSSPPPPQGDGAAGGVVASARDLARFDVALMTDRLISPALRAAMWTPSRSPDGVALPYGLGWFVGIVGGRAAVWHTGLWEAKYSALYLKLLSDKPQARLTLILLANSDGLQWPSELDEAAAERSPFVRAFVAAFTPVGVDSDARVAAMQRAYAWGRERHARDPRFAADSTQRVGRAFRRWRVGDCGDEDAIGAYIAAKLGATEAPDALTFFAAYSRLDRESNGIPEWALLPEELARDLFAWFDGRGPLAAVGARRLGQPPTQPN